MGKRKKLSRQCAALIIIVTVFAAIASLHLLGVFRFLEYKSYDLRVRFMAGNSRPSDDILVILVRQDCLDWAQQERGWGWPWPRQAYAEIIDYMNLGGAESVAIDILFSEPSVYRNAGQTDDALFAAAGSDYGKAVQTVFFSSQSGSARSWPADLNKPLFQTEGFGSLLDHFDIGAETGAQFPIPELREAAGALGCVTGKPDSDGIIRRLRLFTLFDGKAIPGLSAASLMVSGAGRRVAYRQRTGSLEWEGFSIPVNNRGETLLRYRGEIDRYNPYRAMDILQSAAAFAQGEEPLLPPDNFKGAHIFVGLYAPGLFDIFSTPINSVYAGMGCHITMLDNLLQGDFIRESPQTLDLLMLLAAVGLVVLLSMFSRRIYLSVGGVVLCAAVVTAASCFAYGQGLWLPLVTFLAGTLAAFITVTLYNYATEGSQKRFIKSAFSQYLSPKVIEQIIADPSQLNLGGEKREMTAIFTDIRSFSTISEALGDPEKLVELLNFYLTRMSNIVLDHQGTIDKYEGDAIVAFFGAPVHLTNHASLACSAAVSMKQAEAQINREVLAQGLITAAVMDALSAKGIIQSAADPPLFTRFGINSGSMVVGNMGTPSKMNYTIMGNAVNLAARLEGVNKQYRTGGIMISEYTRQQIGDEFILRPLSRARVVGINTPLRLYELLDTAAQAPPELRSMVQRWEQAIALYEARDFPSAGTLFSAVYQANSADLAAQKYRDRCSAYAAAPPDEAAWDNGVDNLTEK